MHFCSNCGNMYYLTFASNTDENNEDADMLIYYCRKCGNKDSELYKQKGNLCVSKTHLVSEKHDFKNIINEYTKYDPTLPRINNIDCPNPECQTNKKTWLIYVGKSNVTWFACDNKRCCKTVQTTVQICSEIINPAKLRNAELRWTERDGCHRVAF